MECSVTDQLHEAPCRVCSPPLGRSNKQQKKVEAEVDVEVKEENGIEWNGIEWNGGQRKCEGIEQKMQGGIEVDQEEKEKEKRGS